MSDRALGALPPRHLLLALAVVAVWGTNFVVIKLALAQLPPLLFATLRFALAFLPAAFFLPRPAVPWSQLAAYGIAIGVGQFGLLYLAIDGHISPGIASLVVQTQVFFTIGAAMVIDRERLRPLQALALVLAAAGIGVILAHTDGTTTALGIVLTLAAAMSWTAGNFVARRAPRGTPMVAYVVWSSAAAVPVLLVLSLLVEGPSRVAAALVAADAGTWAAVAWQSAGNALFGYAAWGWLLARHPAATVAPFALLVPVFGMASAALLLGEPLPGWKLQAAALVLGGLVLNLLAARR